MNNQILVMLFVLGVAFVGGILAFVALIEPRSYAPQKYDPYECGIPTKGTTWLQFNVGYYLFAILFLIFDAETVFLFPWAVVMKDLGITAFIEILIFVFILGLGLAYAWKKHALIWQ